LKNNRTILHVDLDAFFCSVEELLDSSLTGKPFIVGGSPTGRGVVSSASYEARAFGIKSAMPTAQAVRLCPELIIIRGSYREYTKYSREVMGLLRDAAPLMEQLSIDEAFLDVTDDPRGGGEIAAALQQQIRARCRLPTSWGVATNKLVAKIATEVGKPRGLIVVPAGGEARFLEPLPVEMLWGVGPKTRELLTREGIITIGDLARCPAATLTRLVGPYGLELASRSRGEDNRPVSEEHQRRSLSAERTFPTDQSDHEALTSALEQLSEEVSLRLRKENLAGPTVRLKIRWPDFSTITRQVTLAQPTNNEREIASAVHELFHAEWKPGRAIRLLGVGVANLTPPVRQLEMFDRTWEKDERLMLAIDAIREKYGPQAVRKGRLHERRIDEE
jgi:DNA polymerase-4